MLPAWVIVFSIAIRLFSGGRYAWGVVKGWAKPNPITWFLWGLTAMIAFVAQMYEGVGVQAIVTLVLGVSPLVVFGLAVKKHGFFVHFTPLTIFCTAVAVVGIILWQVTNSPVLAITFSIIADTFAGLPTLVKAYKDPSSEYPLPYLLSIVSMGIVLLTITEWTFVASAFIIYMLVSNIFLFIAAAVPLRKMLRSAKRRMRLAFT